MRSSNRLAVIGILLAIVAAGMLAFAIHRRTSISTSTPRPLPPAADAATAQLAGITLGGSFAAEVMVLAGSARGHELAAKFKAGVAANPEWFAEQLQRAKSGEVIPWDPKLGLTEAEYDEFLASTGGLSFKKSHGVTLVVERHDPYFTFTTRGGYPALDALAIKIAVDGSRGETRYGPLPRTSTITASEDQALTGPWNGTCWKMPEPTSLDERQLEVCLGKFRDTPRALLFYQTRSTGDPASNADFALYFAD
jgi:hypothetical protein